MGRNNEELPLGDLTQEAFLVIANEAAIEIGWRIKSISDVGFIAYTENSGYAWNGEITLKIESESSTIQCVPIGSVIDDWGRSKATIQTFLRKFEQLKSGFNTETVPKKYKKLKKGFVPAQEDMLKPLTAPPFETLKGAFSFFIPVKNYFITPLLIDVNLLIFIIMSASGVNVFQPSSESMIKWGANLSVATLDGQWWRLMTSCFLHFGILHLLLNMLALLFIGFLLEPYLGKARFLAAYLLSGIIAGLTSLWWHNFSVSAGASGAILGMCGVFLALLSTNFFDKSMRNALLGAVAGFVGYNLVFGLKSGTDNAAHVGGLLGGILIGYAYLPGLKNPTHVLLSRLSIPLVVVLCVSGSFLVYQQMSTSDTLAYHKGMEQFYATEKSSLESYKKPANSPKEAMLLSIKDHGIVYWKNNASLIKKLDQLDLSADIHIRNGKILRYCELQIKIYQLQYQQIDEDTGKYKPEIQAVRVQINQLLDELSEKKWYQM